MEALSKLLEDAVEKGIIKGISLPNNGPCVSHLLYADDAIIIGEWSVENITNVVRVLRCFHICAGLKINILKSNIYGIGVDRQDVDHVTAFIRCTAAEFPFKYLGANMNRVRNWRPVYDVFESRFSLWKASTLSIGGRVTLIKAVLECLPNYFFSLYKAPVRVIKDLEALMLSSNRDDWKWLGDASGKFSVGSVKRIIDLNTDYSSRYVWGWSKWLPKKCNLFEMDRIQTRSALQKRNIQVVDISCPLCIMGVESVDHLFTSCAVSTVIWQKIEGWCRTPFLVAFSFRHILEAYNWCGLEGQAKEVYHGIVVGVYGELGMVWFSRVNTLTSTTSLAKSGR